MLRYNTNRVESFFMRNSGGPAWSSINYAVLWQSWKRDN